MLHRFLVVLLALILTALTVALVAGHGPWAGQELVGVSRSHGVNEGDLPVIGAWLVGMVACVLLWHDRRA